MLKYEVANNYPNMPHLKALIILEPSWRFPELFAVIRNTTPRLSEISEMFGAKCTMVGELEKLASEVFDGRPAAKLRASITAITNKIVLVPC